jgi:RNA polymerase sigma factor (TIGR02999 family)
MSDVESGLSLGPLKSEVSSNQLFLLVYEELRRLAQAKLAHEKPGQTLQPTALVHEAYVRLVASGNSQRWNSEGHFFRAAAESMNRILIDLARRKKRPKHGGGQSRIDLDAAICLDEDRADELLALDAALDKLAAESSEKAELVKLRYFAGLSHQEAAQALGISRATADRYWAYARAFLRCELKDTEKS